MESSLTIGQRVEANALHGTVRFIGNTDFALGKWVGIELDEPKGKNDGTVLGKKYFECPPDYGIFVRPALVKPLTNSGSKPGTPKKTRPSLSSSRPTTPPRKSGTSSNANTSPNSSKGISSRRSSVTNSLKNSAASSPAVSRKSLSSSLSSLRTSTTTIEEKPQNATSSHSDMKRPSTANSSSSSSSRRVSEINSKTSGSKTTLNTSSSLPKPASSLLSQKKRASLLSSEISKPASSTTLSPVVTNKSIDRLSENHDQNVLLLKKIDALERELISERERSNKIKTKLESEIITLQQQSKKLLQMKKEREDVTTLGMKIDHKENLDDKHTEEANFLKEENQEMKKKAKFMEEEIQALKVQLDQFNDHMESITLDKEMAEEQCEIFKSRIEVYEQRVEEMTLDLSLLREENGLIKDEVTGLKAQHHFETAKKATEDFIQVIKDNNKLKNALLKLHQSYLEQQYFYEDRIEHLEASGAMSLASQEKIKELETQLNEKINIIEDLKVSLDAAMSSERLVQSLTDKNLFLSDQVDELNIALQEMEIIAELNNAIEQTREETEKQLFQELDLKTSQLEDMKIKLSTHEDALADYQKVVLQFRDLTTRLQYELDQATFDDSSMSNRKRSSQSQNMLNLSLQLQSTALEVKAKAVELELRKLEVEQSLAHLKFIQPYLPESFFKEDHVSITCILSLQRLAFKSKLIVQYIDDKYPFNEDQYGPAHRRAFMVKSRLRKLISQFVTFSNFADSCSVVEFTDMGRMVDDMKTIESKLDEWIEKVKHDELMDSPVAEWERISSHLDHLKEVSGISHEHDSSQRMVDYFIACHDSMYAHLKALKYLFPSNINEDESEDVKLISEVEDHWSLLPEMLEKIKENKIMFNRLLRAIEQISSSKSLSEDHINTLSSLKSIVEQSLSFVERASSTTITYFQNQRQKETHISVSHCHQIAFTACEDSFGQSSEMTAAGAMFLQKLKTCIAECENLYEQLQDEKVLVDRSTLEKEVQAPHLVRAEKLKSEYLLNQDMDSQLKKSKEQLVQLAKDCQAKETNVKELTIKIEMLEQKLDSARRQSDALSNLEKELEDVKQNAKLYEEAVGALHADLEDMENENDELRATIRQLEQQIKSSTSTPKMNRLKMSPSLHANNVPSTPNLTYENDATHKSAYPTQASTSVVETTGSTELVHRLNRISQVIKLLRYENGLLRESKFGVCHRQLLETSLEIPSINKKHLAIHQQVKNHRNEIRRTLIKRQFSSDLMTYVEQTVVGESNIVTTTMATSLQRKLKRKTDQENWFARLDLKKKRLEGQLKKPVLNSMYSRNLMNEQKGKENLSTLNLMGRIIIPSHTSKHISLDRYGVIINSTSEIETLTTLFVKG